MYFRLTFFSALKFSCLARQYFECGISAFNVLFCVMRESHYVRGKWVTKSTARALQNAGRYNYKFLCGYKGNPFLYKLFALKIHAPVEWKWDFQLNSCIVTSIFISLSTIESISFYYHPPYHKPNTWSVTNTSPSPCCLCLWNNVSTPLHPSKQQKGVLRNEIL